VPKLSHQVAHLRAIERDVSESGRQSLECGSTQTRKTEERMMSSNLPRKNMSGRTLASPADFALDTGLIMPG
jgi:hypothetical protein